jgi:hypothetical protein
VIPEQIVLSEPLLDQKKASQKALLSAELQSDGHENAFQNI